MDKRANKLHEIFCEVVDRPTHERDERLAEQRSSIQRDVQALLEADRIDLAGDTAYEEAETVASQAPEIPREDSGPHHETVLERPTPAHLRALAEAHGPENLRAGPDLDVSTRSIATGPSDTENDDDGIADSDGGVTPNDGFLTDSLPSGTRVAHYEIIRELGRGGMGAVFLARDIKLGRRVAIKFLNRESSSQLTRRFLLEARATARCTHENIVIIHDVSQHQGMPYMVLEYLRGTSLAAQLKHGPVPAMRAVELIMPVVRALRRAHEQDIVHRDLKPDNIFVTESGVIKVLDFGIAKLIRRSSTHRRGGDAGPPVQNTMDNTHGASPFGGLGLTRHGALIGTMAFMSPEQWNGLNVDHRTDIWAVGIILYKLITGRHPLHPFRGMQLSVIGILDHPMPSARTASVRMDRALADIIDTCLQKDKGQRFADAGTLLDALEALVPGQTGAAPLQSGMCPYPGLTAFQEADADRFFGRSREIASALMKLRQTPIVAVVGSSGVGKSSLVRAGVVPALKRSGEDWETITIRPGRHPMSALANIVAPLVTDDSATLSERVAEHQSVLSRLYREPGYLGLVLREHTAETNHKYLLFIDQFEELYTLVSESRERLAFTACLSGMADDRSSPLRIIVSIRSDFLDRVTEDEQLMAEISAGLFFVSPPGRQSLRDALVQPAEMARYRFETPALVDGMLDALDEAPGSLPLLQFTAARLWDLRDSRRRLFTEQSYHDMGGLSGALASHADAVLTSLSPSAQSLVRTIMLRLVTPERTRAIATVTELRELSHEPDAVERLVGQLVDARLLVIQRSDGDLGSSVEIVHESMISRWPTLTRWLDESQEDVAFLEQLRTAARQWDSKGRADGLLWRAEAMEDARRWRHRYRGKLSDVQDQYLRAVFALATRTVRRKRLAIAAVIAVLSLMVAVGSVALILIRNAEREVRDKLELVERKERERKDALARAEQASGIAQLSREVLAEKNIELASALRRTEEQRELALSAQEQAEAAEKQASEALAETRQAKARVEKLHDKDRQRLRRLESQVGKRGKGLKR